MDGKFLRVFKDWFYLDVNPTELLILSQVAEYNLNNYANCTIIEIVKFISMLTSYVIIEIKTKKKGRTKVWKGN